jgi:hypothetical protein
MKIGLLYSPAPPRWNSCCCVVLILDASLHSVKGLSPDFRVVPLKPSLQPPFSNAFRIERREKGVQLQIEEKSVSRADTLVIWEDNTKRLDSEEDSNAPLK